MSDLSWGKFKPLLADAVVAHLEPIQKRCVHQPCIGFHTGDEGAWLG